MTVKTVTEKINSKGDKNALLHMEDGRDIWTPEYDKALPLLGKEIPTDWYQDEGQYGPRAFPPRAKGQGGARPGGGGKATWYNSEDGVRFTQERMDRRTALMTAKDFVGHEGATTDVVRNAEQFYDWLRESSPAVTGEEAVAKKGPVGANAGVSSPSSTPTGSTTQYPVDWPQEGR